MQAVVGYSPGSTFELYLRMLTRHIGKHIPGNPNIVVQHMPGAGSLKATNYLAAIAPKDGSVFGMPNPVNTIEPLIDPKNSRFDPRSFVWLGSLNTEISTCAFWAKDLRTFDDLKKREVVVGSTGPASGSTIDARVLGTLTGIKFKVVTGYGNLGDIRLASERGETDGFCGLLVSALKTDYWEQYKSGRMAVPVQMGLSKHAEFPNIPNAYELVTQRGGPPAVPADLRAVVVRTPAVRAARHRPRARRGAARGAGGGASRIRPIWPKPRSSTWRSSRRRPRPSPSWWTRSCARRRRWSSARGRCSASRTGDAS